MHFNPRSPCGERQQERGQRWSYPHFNPRSPCGERLCGSPSATMALKFQSTLPVWGATAFICHFCRASRISIHAPRVGSDASTLSCYSIWLISIHAPRVGSDHDSADGRFDWRNFNPRSPCGERRSGCFGGLAGEIFQSTLPVWGATDVNHDFIKSFTISIHAPRVGSDSAVRVRPRKPKISIHAPRVGSDGGVTYAQSSFFISIHAPRVGSDKRCF